MLDRRAIRVHVDRHLLDVRETLPTRLRAAFEDLLQERGLLADDPAPAVGPLGHPVFELPVWMASRLRDEGIETPEETLGRVLGVSSLGYFHVRAQDDWLDATSTGDPTLVALAEALLALCNRLLVSVVGRSARFWDFYAEVFTAYSESLAHTTEVRMGEMPVARETFEHLLAQARPLVIPCAALLDRAGRWQLLPLLEEFVFASTAASQLINDLTDLDGDRRLGHRTWTLAAIGGSDGLWSEAIDASMQSGEGRVQERISQALSYHERSAQAARALALTAADDWLADRRSKLEGFLGSLSDKLLSVFVEELATRRAGPPADALQRSPGRE